MKYTEKIVNQMRVGGGKKKPYGIENYNHDDVEFGEGGSRRAWILAWALDPLAMPEKATYETNLGYG